MKNLKNEEILEIWDWETGKPTGKPVPRSEAHKSGIPHEGVHLWIIKLSGDNPEILFQYRSDNKEMYPSCLDITVGGHVPFGLKENKIQKESEEEIGIIPLESDLIDLGYCRYEEKNESFFHREFQHVYLLIDNRPLSGYRFNDNEVTAVFAVPFNDLEKILLEEHRFTINGFNGKRNIIKEVSRNEFHPQLFDSSMKYYMNILINACRQVIGNESITAKMSI